MQKPLPVEEIDARAPAARRAAGPLMYALLGPLIVLIASIGFLAWRREAMDATCEANLSTIDLALHNYHEAYGSFPPAYTTDARGRPMHSWRVLILPFADQNALYHEYNLNEPWNGPNNSRLAERMPSFYACSAHRRGSSAETSYAVIVGPETAFPGPWPSALSQFRDPDVVLVAEVDHGGVGWMEPRDLSMPALTPEESANYDDALRASYQDLRRQGLADPSRHPKGMHLLTTLRVIHYDGDGLVFRSMATIAGDEVWCVERP